MQTSLQNFLDFIREREKKALAKSLAYEQKKLAAEQLALTQKFEKDKQIADSEAKHVLADFNRKMEDGRLQLERDKLAPKQIRTLNFNVLSWTYVPGR